MITIVIANEKGGVAKTTTTISLGGALVETGASVLMVDLDAQANLSLAIGIEPVSGLKSITNVLLDSSPLLSVIHTTEVERLDIAIANHDMGMAERLLPLRPSYEKTLKNAFKEADLKYDYILIDCPPFLGTLTLNALVAADTLIIPTQAEYFSIYALRNLMNSVKQVRARYNPTLTYRLLLTMFDRRNRIHRNLSEQLHNTFKSGLLHTIIEIDTKLRESNITGLPIMYTAPHSRGSLQYRALAQEIMEHVKETTPQSA
jgi:chromosome partitioning protein